MFDPSDQPRVFGIAPGEDFPRALVQGVLRRMKGSPPEALAHVRILVNTRRMQRRIKALFAEEGPLLLPKIGLVTEIDSLVPDLDLPNVVPPIRRQLELAKLVSALIDADPTIAPRAALFDLSDSLARLLDECQGEGIDPDAVVGLETGDQSGHWERSRKFLSLVLRYVAQGDDQTLDPEARQRAALVALGARWTASPPQSPILVAGSTGSRGTTSELMRLVAGLPQGCIVLPGYDDALPDQVWKALMGENAPEDHPQFRFSALLKALSLAPDAVGMWDGNPPDKARNALISLSLRPAPVTHQWLRDGPELGDLRESTRDFALLEAPNQRKEAAALAVAMRLAIENGESVALVTPDRTLGRRVAAVLARWDIVPDDSAGRPLAQTAPGRLLRQVVRMNARSVTPEDLIALLRHPLTNTGGSDRGLHLLMTQEFELFLRKSAVSTVTTAELTAFSDIDQRRVDWVRWIADILADLQTQAGLRVSEALASVVANAERLARGPSSSGSGELWEKAPGRDTKAAIDNLIAQADTGLDVTWDEVTRLLDRTLQGENTRNSDDSRADVMIWGTLEARVQGADVVILGGLNEGVWPARPAPDPWLNRRMRRAAGLLLPERQIGLSAHDYQQVAGARRVIFSRSLKDDDAETVASRWLNRLTNLIGGLPDQSGPAALEAMRDRGTSLIAHAENLDRPLEERDKAPRPAPVPPLALRPRMLSVTEIETLIRDPYAVYARRILGLTALKPLRPGDDAAMRGTVFHTILHKLLQEAPFSSAESISRRFLEIAHNVLISEVPWPAVRSLWFGHLERLAPKFAAIEMERQGEGRPAALEVWGEFQVPGHTFGVKGKADRIDRLSDGRFAVYDYKSGAPPTRPVMLHFTRQLPIEAVMVEAGAFKDVPPGEVAFISHIGLNKEAKSDRYPLAETKDWDLKTETIQEELTRLLSEFFHADKGYPSRRAMEKVRWDGDYDHLARFGEWDDTQPASLVIVS